jgi:hypothetical protein
VPAHLSQDEIERHIAILQHSGNRGELASSAIALAASEDSTALLSLAGELSRKEFLNRLDDTAAPERDTSNLVNVFNALADHPVAASAQLCITVYAQTDFWTIPARINFLLQALAAVRPTSPEAADVFRASSEEGFAQVNGPLLIANESPLALKVFEELIAGDWVESYVKVDMLHRSVLPSRTHLPVLQACATLYEHELPDDVRDGLIETLFDYQSRLWFGPVRQPPIPPTWESASEDALDFVLPFVDRVLQGLMNEALRPAVESTRAKLESIHQSRTA